MSEAILVFTLGARGARIHGVMNKLVPVGDGEQEAGFDEWTNEIQQLKKWIGVHRLFIRLIYGIGDSCLRKTLFKIDRRMCGAKWLDFT